MPNPFGFANVHFVPGVGYVEGAAPGRGSLKGALGNEEAVMMISGLGSESKQVGVNEAGEVLSMAVVGRSLQNWATTKVKVLGIELPLWVWLLIAAGALGAGYVFFKKYQEGAFDGLGAAGKKLSAKAVRKEIEQTYYRLGHGVQINIMDIGKVFQMGEEAYANGGSIEDAVAAAIAKFRVN